MVDLNKLNSQFNIKDIDAAKFIKALSEQQNTFLKLVLIVGSLVCAGLIYNSQRIKEGALRTQMSEAQEKINAIKSRDAAVQDLNNFKSSQPKKLNEFELITLISNFAQSCHVSIPSLSPAESKDMGLYDAINVNFEAVGDNFKDMMLFLRKIERSNLPLRIDSWAGSEDVDGKITFNIALSAVLIHT